MQRILIVDDSETARLLIQRCLEMIGLDSAEILFAEDGDQALRQLNQQPTDLIISDLTMPNMDGEQLLQHVQTAPHLASIPVLIVSSSGTAPRQQNLRQQGAYGVLHKPITPANLHEMLQPLFFTVADSHDS